MDQNFEGSENLRVMYGFEDISFASLSNSEIEYIFKEVVDKNANNSFLFQKKEVSENYKKDQAETDAKALSKPELHYLTTFSYEG